MSSSDFRQIANGAEPGKAERLFRAAVSAFCALTRPSRREMAQLEDLALPLFDSVSSESKRYVAATLSEIDHAPPALIRRLCDEPVGIAAPLLIRSTALTDIDLIALIGRHGLAHARAIGRRPGLNPTIANLVRALERPSLVRKDRVKPGGLESRTASAVTTPPVVSATGSDASREAAAESVRRRLRTMMLPSGAADGSHMPPDHLARAALFAKLRATALSGHLAYFQTALTDALSIDFRQARSITEAEDYSDLVHALKALEVDTEQAFLLAAAVFPRCFTGAESIRRFVDSYRLCRPEAVRAKLRGWNAEATAGENCLRRPERPDANPPERPAPGILKAS